MRLSLSRVQLFATAWTVAHQAPLSWGFSRQGYRRGLPCSPPGDLPNPGIEPRSPILQADSEAPGKPRSTGVEAYPFFRRIVLTQAASWGLLHCRRILYQLSYQGSPSRHVNLDIMSKNYKATERKRKGDTLVTDIVKAIKITAEYTILSEG